MFENAEATDSGRASNRTAADQQSPSAGSDRAADGGLLTSRIAAFLLDTGLVVGACGVLASVVSDGRRRRVGLTAILAAVVGFGYHVLLEGRFDRTVGKRATGIAVVRSDGSQCSYTAATLRTSGRFVDALPIGYLVGIAAILLTDRDQRLGDLLADTVVVRTDELGASER